MQNSISVKFKIEGVVNEDNIDEIEVIIKEGVQAVLEELKEF